MKIFTFYSDSHKHLLDLFLKSFFKNCSLDLTIKKIDQKCSGDYHSNGWKEAMVSKIQYIIDSLKQCDEGEIMIHSDCDILICDNIDGYIEESLSNKDIVFQWDSSGVCMGFFACVKNNLTVKFFDKLLFNLHLHKDDQYCANHLLSIDEFKNLKWDLFDHKCFTVGMLNIMYNEDIEISIPKDLNIFHANFSPNLNLKTQLMQKVFDFLNYQ
jgi:hypothetical protein